MIQLREQTLESAEKNFAVAACDNKLLNVDGPNYNNSSIRLWRWRLMSKYFFHLGRLELALDLLEKQELLRSVRLNFHLIQLLLVQNTLLQFGILVKCLLFRCGSSSQESSIPFAVTVRELLHREVLFPLSSVQFYRM